ncbi:deoxyribodipyrimidine photo-lyase [Desulfopila sp. IMCC35008]|uniref:deoxyribodipyrimidine photo-lyase n=1 Tax=Desulfopila sp. IMCC35008 TaxID=2653858 RepID=UPI001F0DF7B6|nr:deoxyribodipyrimidine photo-lyase [Desulfopila sp. IMCC35008]
MGPVVYWMSRDQRVSDNWALLYAQQEAIVHKRTLLVVYCCPPDFVGITSQQLHFMVEGLRSVATHLHKIGIGWIFVQELPDIFLPNLVREVDAHSLVCDFTPLRIHKEWNTSIIQQLTVPFREVDSHNIIPAWVTSAKKEYAAYTIRPKIKRLLGEYLTDIPAVSAHPFPCTDPFFGGHEMWTVPDFPGFHSPAILPFTSGPDQALAAARNFVDYRLQNYGTNRNDPCQNGQSGLSPYLHFGQLSAQRLASMVLTAGWPEETTEPFLEELIVRRELSDNFCFYEDKYDGVEGFSNWAQKTLREHWHDTREFIYTLAQFEAGETHEELWNSCQRDLVYSGKLHGFLRMYWAKKILEWSPDPETALSFAIALNDKYSLDGHDPNGYTGVAWSIGGVHDRAWGERPVFGKIRYMNEAGCRRKFDVDSYITKVAQLTGIK